MERFDAPVRDLVDFLAVDLFAVLRLAFVDLVAVLRFVVFFFAAPVLAFVDLEAVLRFVVFFLAVPRLALVDLVAVFRFVVFFFAIPLLALVDFFAVVLRGLVDRAAPVFDLLLEVFLVAISVGSCGYSVGHPITSGCLSLAPTVEQQPIPDSVQTSKSANTRLFHTYC